jgi:ribosomal protein S18 acetylase RimI-like enzyme
MTDPVEIHHITLANTSLLDTVTPDVFDEPIVPAALIAFVNAPGHAMFIAINGGSVVGQARGVIQHQPDTAPVLYIDNLGVAPANQRRSIATRLVAALRAWAKERGATTVWVATETDNDQAKAFYAALGLTHTTVAYFEKE